MADHDPKIAPVRDMRQRVGLLAGQNKAALLGIDQGGLAVPVIHPMALPSGHRVPQRGAGAVRPRSFAGW